MLGDIFGLLVDTAVGLLVIALLCRFLMQAVRVSFRNPIGEFVIDLTDWAVRPARRIIPGLYGLDLACIVLAWLLHVLALLLLAAVRGHALSVLSVTGLPIVALLGLVHLLQSAVYLVMGIIIVQVAISWINPHAPLAWVFDALSRPFLGAFRRLIPPLGRIDLSPVFVLLLAQVLLMFIQRIPQLLMGVAG